MRLVSKLYTPQLSMIVGRDLSPPFPTLPPPPHKGIPQSTSHEEPYIVKCNQQLGVFTSCPEV